MGDRRLGDGSERLRELHHAAIDIMAASDAEAIYRTTVETAETVLDFDYCSVFVHEEDVFKVAASSHRDRGATIAKREGVLERTFRADDSFLIANIEASSIANPLDSAFRSGISVPIEEDAVLQAVSETANYYGETDLELAELLAIHAEAALEQVRSQSVIEEQKRKIEELHSVAIDLESCSTRETLFDLMRTASKEILGFGWCTLYVMEDGRFVTAMASERSPVAVGEYPFSEGNSKAREVYQTGESLLVDDVDELEDGEPTTDRIRAALQVPVGDLGVYCAAHEQPGTFDEDDLELAELLASSVAEAYKRIEAQEQLRKRKQELEEQNERLDKFASVVSHDLRNPLATAEGYLELAEETGEADFFESVRDAHERMVEMIDDLLTMARAETVIDETERIELPILTLETWENTQTEDATLQRHLPGNATVEGDADLLRHVLENLFHNAVKHNDSAVTVTVGALEDGDGFYVADDGVGIPEHERDKIFEYGYTDSDDGTGFGLGIVHELIESHGWEIAVGSSGAGGARFEIRTDP